jgi:type VI secretion system protein ImpJ
MYLGPHEFQAQARYFEDAIQFAAAALWFQCYGLIGCTLDSDALRNGTVSLVHASGIFPDGTPFHIPQSDAAPAVRPIAELFPPTGDRLTVFLGIAGRKPGGRNCAVSPQPDDIRYFAELRNFNDETSGVDERPIPIRRKNLRLLLESEFTDKIVSLPLACVRRDGSGHFICSCCGGSSRFWKARVRRSPGRRRDRAGWPNSPRAIWPIFGCCTR